jgi:hypothetical protein
MYRRSPARAIALSLALLAVAVGVVAARPAPTHAAHGYRTVNLRADAVSQSSITIRWDPAFGYATISHRLRTTANSEGVWASRSLSEAEAQDRVLSFTGLQPGTTYSFIIEDCALTCPYSTRLDVTTLPPPPPPVAPTNLHVCGSGSQPEVCQGGGVLLRWTDNATTEDWYEFQWAKGQPGTLPRASDYTTVMLSANRTSHSFSPPSGGYFYFRVRACNSSGCSAFSQTEHTVPPVIAAAP